MAIRKNEDHASSRHDVEQMCRLRHPVYGGGGLSQIKENVIAEAISIIFFGNF
jgi:hypothetical protein